MRNEILEKKERKIVITEEKQAVMTMERNTMWDLEFKNSRSKHTIKGILFSQNRLFTGSKLVITTTNRDQEIIDCVNSLPGPVSREVKKKYPGYEVFIENPTNPQIESILDKIGAIERISEKEFYSIIKAIRDLQRLFSKTTEDAEASQVVLYSKKYGPEFLLKGQDKRYMQQTDNYISSRAEQILKIEDSKTLLKEAYKLALRTGSLWKDPRYSGADEEQKEHRSPSLTNSDSDTE